MGILKNWKPKTVAGKILKGSAIGIGGGALLATGVGAVVGAVGGTGLLAGAAAGVGTAVKVVKGAGTVTKTVMSKVSASAVKLVTGQTKEEREILKEAKQDARLAQSKANLVAKLVKTGLSEAQARSKAGLSDEGSTYQQADKTVSELLPEEAAGKLIKPKGVNQNLVYAGLGLAALFILPKILKR